MRIITALLLLSVAAIVYLLYVRHVDINTRLQYRVQNFAHIEQVKQERIKLLTQLSVDSTDIVFVGTSLTEGFPLEILGTDFKNRGIGGGTLKDIEVILNSVRSKHPRAIFFEGGINDIKNTVDPTLAKDSVLTKYRSMIKSRMYVQSLLPVNRQYFPNVDHLNNLIKVINKELRLICDSAGATYVDIHEAFGDSLSNDVTIDGLHINYKGYTVWSSALLPYLSK